MTTLLRKATPSLAGSIGNEAAKEFNIKSYVISQGFFTQNTQHYTINKHFYNEKDVEVKVEKGGAKSGC